MEILKQRINEEGRVLDNRVLKVDSFLNHQIDPALFQAIGKEIAKRFEGKQIDRIVTIEASGIALALMAAIEMNVPLVFARKKKSILMTDEVYHSVVYSYTKEENYDVTVSKRFLPAGEHVLIIDDFLASGEAAMGLAKLVESAGDTVEGIAIVIEKSFQPGRERLERAGYHVESLIRIERFEDNRCIFVED
ncbi:xanthine phosphoribosyltransferase [Veillonella montpellierensis DNF00314]|uniref:Xanthine phosphoribosyltransferase n=1 Tax=Veillonella montpellierensis DNF00314 TaxID=1401067 RepID=A0A096AIU5_9FIRM|nr:xanthine phosphoribosyltransferase [Veillonella montpellierensis]KGF46506.1 xanthine phosphoribosyltransferase [Veillonella montpellierensis DNF00314]